jgi:hypothetical protein
VLLALTVYTLLWLNFKMKEKYAGRSAIELSENIPPPANAVIIKSWSRSYSSSLRCYHGNTLVLYGTTLELSEVAQYYRTYAEQQGWFSFSLPHMVDIGGEAVDVDENAILMMKSGEIDNYNIRVDLCTPYSACNGYSSFRDFPSTQEDKKIFEAAQKQYETAFVLTVVYVPETNFFYCGHQGG